MWGGIPPPWRSCVRARARERDTGDRLKLSQQEDDDGVSGRGSATWGGQVGFAVSGPVHSEGSEAQPTECVRQFKLDKVV